jgi:hypothetical protein
MAKPKGDDSYVDTGLEEVQSRGVSTMSPNGYRRVLTAHYGKLLRAAIHIIRNLSCGQFSPVD